MKTSVPKASQIEQQWYLVDAADQVLGRLSTRIARLLRGKHKPYFTPHLDTGDYVVVINAEKVKLTGSKVSQKFYKSFSGYPSGQSETSFKHMLTQKPEEIIIHAVKGMLPKNILGRRLLQKLKVYAGSEHPHQGQQPQLIVLDK